MQLTTLAGMAENVKEGCLYSQCGSDSSNFACYCPYVKCVLYDL